MRQHSEPGSATHSHHQCCAPRDFAVLQDPRTPDHAQHNQKMCMTMQHTTMARSGDDKTRTSRATLAASAASTSRHRCAADCQQRHSHSHHRHARCTTKTAVVPASLVSRSARATHRRRQHQQRIRTTRSAVLLTSCASMSATAGLRQSRAYCPGVFPRYVKSRQGWASSTRTLSSLSSL